MAEFPLAGPTGSAGRGGAQQPGAPRLGSPALSPGCQKVGECLELGDKGHSGGGEAGLGDNWSLGRRGREGSGGGEEAETVAAPKPQLLGGRVWEAQVETDAPPVSPKWRAQREGGSVGPLARFSVGWGSLPGAKYSHPPRGGGGGGAHPSRNSQNPARISGAPRRIGRLRCVPSLRPPLLHSVPVSRRPLAAPGERVSSLEQGGRGQERAEAGNPGAPLESSADGQGCMGSPPPPRASWLVS